MSGIFVQHAKHDGLSGSRRLIQPWDDRISQGLRLLDTDRVYPKNGFDMTFEEIASSDSNALKADQRACAVWNVE